MVGSSSREEGSSSTSIAKIAIVAALGLLGVVVVTVAVTVPQQQQQAEATGCINPNAPGGGSLAFNASQGRCAR